MAFVKKVKAKPLIIFTSVLAIIVLVDVIYGYIIHPILNGGL